MGPSPRLLVIEDDAVLSAWLCDVLREAGYAICAIAGDGPGAVRAAVAHRPDLLLVDIHLQDDTDGLAAAAEIAERIGTPALFLTGHAARFCEAAVGVACLEKPFTETALLDAVAFALAPRVDAAGPAAPNELLVRAEPLAPTAAPPGLAEGQARFKGVFDSASHGIGIVDLDLRLVDVNPAFAALVDQGEADRSEGHQIGRAHV